METTIFTTRRLLGAVAVVLAAAAGLVLLNATRAEAAPECCDTSYSADGKTMYVTGYVSYRGELLYMSIGQQRCLSRAGDHRAYIKATIPTKYMPNGKHLIYIVTRINGQAVYSTQTFTIDDSPAVSVEVTSPKATMILTDSPTLKLHKMGAIKRNLCTIDGRDVGCGGSQVGLSGLSEGRHVFKATVKGRDGYSSTDRKEFKVDTQAPTAPTVVGGDGAWSNSVVQLEAKGSSDAGAGLKDYQYQRSLDGGTTWGAIQNGNLLWVEREGETHFRFRALDRAGRKSDWVPAVTRIDTIAPEGEASVTVTEGDPCANQFPISLAVSGGTDATSGVEYRWLIQERQPDGNYLEREEIGAGVTLTNATAYYLYVSTMDAAGNEGPMTTWSTSDGCF